MPLYNAFSERNANSSWSYLRSIADDLWEQLIGKTVTPNHEFLDKYPNLAPNDDWPVSEFTMLNPLAENAVLALGSASECHVSEDGECAVLAAEQAFEAVDYLAQNADDLDYCEIGGEEAILISDVVQKELKRQIDALALLEITLEQDSEYIGVINSLREQSIESGAKLRRVAETLVKTE